MADTDFFNHPIFERHAVLLETPMIKRLTKFLEDFLWGNAVGCCLYGDYRIGKSWAVYFIIQHLISLSRKRVFCHHFTLDETDKSTRLGFQRSLALSVGIKTKQGIGGPFIFGDVVTYFEDQMMLKKCNQAILFIDEADWMSMGQLNSAASIFNYFDAKRVDLRVILLGNTAEMESLTDKLQENDQGKVLERFFKHRHRLTGIESMKELEECLKCYDDLRYPDDGLSYAQFFAKGLSGTDWTLASMTELIWQTYVEEFASPLKLESWSMESFSSSIKTLLVSHLHVKGMMSESQLKKDIIESITASGLAGNLVRSA